MADDYFKRLDQAASRAIIPVGQHENVAAFVSSIKPSYPDVSGGLVTGVPGALVGAYYGSKVKETLLGGLAGFSLGRNLPAIAFRPEERRAAFCNLGQMGAGLLAARLVPSHRKSAFALAWVLAGLGLYYGGLRR